MKIFPVEINPAITEFLAAALMPVGSTMYIWGGGWNDDNTGAGADALRVGPNPEWQKFFETRTPKYNFRDYMYRRGCGLDCSGYVGWAVYNFLARFGMASEHGYVFKAGEQARRFADMGLGFYTDAADVKDRRAGDIMSAPEHVYVVVRECDDGSILLLHSSPPGVQLTGTCTASGSNNSEAAYLAHEYMRLYCAKWYNKFGCEVKGMSYLTEYSRFRWTQLDKFRNPCYNLKI